MWENQTKECSSVVSRRLAEPEQENESGETTNTLEPKDASVLSLGVDAIYALCKHVLCSKKS
jgi:hypothetical protein